MIRILLTSLAISFLPGSSICFGQASVTALRPIDISTYSGVTSTNSGFAHQRSLGLTLCVDTVVFAMPALSVATEARVTAPMNASEVTESNALGGIRIDRQDGPVRLWGDVLYGRAQMDYAGQGISVPQGSVAYTQSRSAIYMFGFGTSIDLTPTLSIYFDQQLERLSSPVTSNRHALALPLTLGLSFHLPYLKHGHPYSPDSMHSL